MSVFFRSILAAVCVVLIVSRVTANHRLIKLKGKWKKTDLSSYPIDPSEFPIYFLLIISTMAILNPDRTFYTLSLYFGIILDIAVYYILLMIFRTIMKRRFTAKTIAIFWVLPNFMYLLLFPVTAMLPKRIVVLSENLWLIIFVVWITGFIIVLLFYMINHLRYRKQILAKSAAVTDEHIIDLFRKELAGLSLSFGENCLTCSGQVSAPFTIGLHSKSIRIVLPHTQYSDDEYRLIFRHELIHLHREDNMAKFYLAFVTALNWYNPLIWKAMRFHAEDIEKSCDEAMMVGADKDARKEYAELILNSSCDTRGFTTCLSSSAKSMKERLSAILHERKERFGLGWVSFAVCVLILFGGRNTIGILYGKLGDHLLDGRVNESFEQVTVIDYHHNAITQTLYDTENPEMWIDQLSNLSIIKVADEYWEFVEADFWIGFYFHDQVYSLFFEEFNEGVLIRDAEDRDRTTRGIYYTEDITIEEIIRLIQKDCQRKEG
ncbi:MAG: M56 family metallopeptidase [Erysipelotrichaceae bacterium]|nr:M56 family metallopeptidase [Erysipelotrichaceae bacterium]